MSSLDALIGPTITLPDDGDGASVFIAALAANKDAIEWLAGRHNAVDIQRGISTSIYGQISVVGLRWRP